MPTPKVSSIRASPSNLRLFRECRYRFKLAVIDGRDKEFPLQSAPLTMGSNVHAALTRFFGRDPGERSEKVLLQDLRDVWKKNRHGFETKEVAQEYWRQAGDALQHFARTEDILARPVMLEEYLSRDVDDFTISGRIDRVDRDPDGRYHVIDYKTGKQRQPPERLATQIYSALATNELKTDELRFSYLYLGRERDSWVTEEVTLQFIDEGLDEVRRQMVLIRAETDFPAKPSPLCEWCQFPTICDDGRKYLARRSISLTDDDLPIDF